MSITDNVSSNISEMNSSLNLAITSIESLSKFDPNLNDIIESSILSSSIQISEKPNISNIVKFIYTDNNGTWPEQLEYLIKSIYNTCDIFSIKDIYRDFEDILQRKHPRSSTIKDSIKLTVQKLRDKNIIKFIDYSGNYQLL